MMPGEPVLSPPHSLRNDRCGPNGPPLCRCGTCPCNTSFSSLWIVWLRRPRRGVLPLSCPILAPSDFTCGSFSGALLPRKCVQSRHQCQLLRCDGQHVWWPRAVRRILPAHLGCLGGWYVRTPSLRCTHLQLLMLRTYSAGPSGKPRHCPP